MTSDPAGVTSPYDRFGRQAGICLLGLLILYIFVEGAKIDAVLVGAAVGAMIALATRGRFVSIGTGWPYALYGLGLAVSLSLSWTPASLGEVGRQVLFVGLIVAVVQLRLGVAGRAAVAGLLLAGLSAIATAALGDAERYRFEQLDRALGYGLVEQWGGYPELGLLAAMGAAGTLAMVLLGRSAPLRASAAVLCAGFVLVVTLSYSRAAWVTVVIVGTTLAVAAWRRRGGRTFAISPRRITIAAVLVAAVTVMVVRQGQDSSFSAVALRADEWSAATQMLADHPLAGVGPGRYPAAYLAYRGETGEPGQGSHAHNAFLQAGAELGVLGLLGYVAIWASVLRRTVVGSGTTPSGRLQHVLFACLLTLLLRNLVDNFFAFPLPTAFPLLLLTGILFGLAYGR